MSANPTNAIINARWLEHLRENLLNSPTPIAAAHLDHLADVIELLRQPWIEEYAGF